MKVFLGILAGIAVLVLLFILGFAGKWFQTGVEIVSPDNVKEQYAEVTRQWEALVQTADNACLAQQDHVTDPNSPVLVESPALAYIATYREVRADYNAAMKNVFEAGLVAPPGYPKDIPNWDEASGADPDFCEIGQKLTDLKDAA